MLQGGAHAQLHGLQVLAAGVDVKQVAAKEAEDTRTNLAAHDLLLQADGTHHAQGLGLDDAQVGAHVHREDAVARADLVDLGFDAAGLDVVVHLGEAADDVVVRAQDGAAVVRQPGHRALALLIGQCMLVAIAQLAPVGVGQLQLGHAGVKALAHIDGAAELAQRRIDHQRSALGDDIAIALGVLAGVVLDVAHGNRQRGAAIALLDDAVRQAGKAVVQRGAVVARARALHHGRFVIGHTYLLVGGQRAAAQQQGGGQGRQGHRAAGQRAARGQGGKVQGVHGVLRPRFS